MEQPIKYASFEQLPRGSRIKYSPNPIDKIWTIIDKYRKEDGKMFFGTLAEWVPDMDQQGDWVLQSMCSHIPEDQGGDCPDQVIFIN